MGRRNRNLAVGLRFKFTAVKSLLFYSIIGEKNNVSRVRESNKISIYEHKSLNQYPFRTAFSSTKFLGKCTISSNISGQHNAVVTSSTILLTDG